MKKIAHKVILPLLFLISQNIHAQTAQLQLIHNCADPSLQLIDVYINDSLVADDIIFRSATTFTTYSVSTTLNIGIAPNSSTSVNDTLKNFEVQLQPNDTAIAIINGVLDTTQFAVNPDGIATDLNILVQTNIRGAAINANQVDFIIVQNATDLAKSDFVIRDVKNLANDILYNGSTNYDSTAAISFTLDIKPFANDSIIKSYQIDFSGMDGSAGVLLASGFQDPTANLNGPPLSFFAVFSNGTVIEYFPVSIAKLQAINNSADPALDSIDIYALGNLVVDNFHFRSATALFDVPGDIPLEIAVAPGNSTSVNDTIRSFTLTFQNGKNYVAIASGVLDTAAFATNPEGADNSFKMILQDGVRWKAQNTNDFDFRFLNGVTDAPSVDLKFSGGNIITDNAPYASLMPYNVFTTSGTYNIDITDSSGINNYNSYQIVTDTIAGQSAVIFFSGFINPANNQNGSPYSLFVAFPQGNVIELNTVTNVSELIARNELQLFPNPAIDFITISIDGANNGTNKLKIFNMTGNLVSTNIFSGNKAQVDLRKIDSGIYLVEVICEGKVYRNKLVIQ